MDNLRKLPVDEMEKASGGEISESFAKSLLTLISGYQSAGRNIKEVQDDMRAVGYSQEEIAFVAAHW